LKKNWIYDKVLRYNNKPMNFSAKEGGQMMENKTMNNKPMNFSAKE